MHMFEDIKPGTHLTELIPAAKKLTALTWRAGSEIAVLEEKRDPTLVRHICDLRMTCDQYDAAQIIALAHEVMMADVQECGSKFPGWEKDPLGDTLHAIKDI